MSLSNITHVLLKSPITTAASPITVSQSRASASAGSKATRPRARLLGHKVIVCAIFLNETRPLRRLRMMATHSSGDSLGERPPSLNGAAARPKRPPRSRSCSPCALPVCQIPASTTMTDRGQQQQARQRARDTNIHRVPNLSNLTLAGLAASRRDVAARGQPRSSVGLKPHPPLPGAVQSPVRPGRAAPARPRRRPRPKELASEGAVETPGLAVTGAYTGRCADARCGTVRALGYPDRGLSSPCPEVSRAAGRAGRHPARHARSHDRMTTRAECRRAARCDASQLHLGKGGSEEHHYEYPRDDT